VVIRLPSISLPRSVKRLLPDPAPGGKAEENHSAEANVHIEVRDSETEEVIKEQSVANTTTTGMSHACGASLVPAEEDDYPASEMKLRIGSGSGTPAYSDTSLFNKVTEVDVTTYSRSGDTATLQAFIAGSVANGHEITEVGLGFGGELSNHAMLSSSIQKDESTEATVTTEITFNTA